MTIQWGDSGTIQSAEEYKCSHALYMWTIEILTAHIAIIIIVFYSYPNYSIACNLDYGVEFKGSLHTVLETFFVFLEVTQFGSPSRDATISITRDDNGPAFNDTVVSMGGVIAVDGFIPNDEIRLGDRQITLTLTTSDDLIEIGPLNTTIINTTEVDRK